MQLTNLPGIRNLRRAFQKAPGPVPTTSQLPPNTVTVPPLTDAVEALTHKPGALEKPLILVNGLARNAHEWDKMVPWLTSNPENEFGGVYRVGKDDEFQATIRRNPEARVFVLDPSNNVASPRVLGGELRRLIDHLVKETGAKEVDVVGHSQGGLDILAAVDQGESQIDRVVSIATPWKGAAIASVARRFDGLAGGWFENLFAPLGEDQGALLDIRPKEKNPWLQGAHQRLAQNPEAPEFHSITGSGTPTPGGRNGGDIEPGDGFVSVDSGLGLEGAKNYHLPPGDWKVGDEHFRAFNLMDVNHLGIVSNSGTFKTLGRILDGQSAPPSDSAPVQGVQPDHIAFPAESVLNSAESAVHKHLREMRDSSVKEWSGSLDRVAGLRQEIVESEIGLRAAELKASRGKLIAGIGAAAAVAGVALLGPLAVIPGLVAAGVGVSNFLSGREGEKQHNEELEQSVEKAEAVRQEVEDRLAAVSPGTAVESRPKPGLVALSGV